MTGLLPPIAMHQPQFKQLRKTRANGIQSVAESRAKMNQLQHGQVGNANFRDMMADFLNQMNSSVVTLVNSTVAEPSTDMGSAVDRSGELMEQYNKAC